MNTIRRETLRQYIERQRVVTMTQLADLLPDVSLMTIHRDLNFLQECGLIEKMHGGAQYVADRDREVTFSAREIIHREAKLHIAMKATALLEDAASIFVDAGTTMMAFARQFPDLRLNVATTGPNIALALAGLQNPSVTLCGGTLNKSNLTVSGESTMEVLLGINIDTAFLVASGYSTQAGFTCGMESEARIKALVISKARKVVMLMDTSKLERVLPYTFATMSDLHLLITEQEPAQLSPFLLEQADTVTLL